MNADPLEVFVRPWVKASERFWGEVLSSMLTAEPSEEFAAARQREFLAARLAFRRATDDALRLADLPSRADIDALAEDIADIRRRLDRIEDQLDRPRPAER